MTDAHIFQLLGLALCAMGISWATNPKVFKQLLSDIAGSRGFLLFSGILSLIIGYLITALYETDSIVIIVIGWIAILKGLAIIMFPSTGVKTSFIFKCLKKYFDILPWIVLIVGMFALYLGYFV